MMVAEEETRKPKPSRAQMRRARPRMARARSSRGIQLMAMMQIITPEANRRRVTDLLELGMQPSKEEGSRRMRQWWQAPRMLRGGQRGGQLQMVAGGNGQLGQAGRVEKRAGSSQRLQRVAAKASSRVALSGMVPPEKSLGPPQLPVEQSPPMRSIQGRRRTLPVWAGALSQWNSTCSQRMSSRRSMMRASCGMCDGSRPLLCASHRARCTLSSTHVAPSQRSCFRSRYLRMPMMRAARLKTSRRVGSTSASTLPFRR
mmetsp:Transcript_38365/g.90167  ORF Transcript_38365/g.90167 Transcript_38365/m.90167 type:complete len:258 (+) Transcript_38365:758-1531(+)